MAKPVVLDTAAVLDEHGSLHFDPRDVPSQLYTRFWAAVEPRDPEVLRAASQEIRKEARRRMLEGAR